MDCLNDIVFLEDARFARKMTIGLVHKTVSIEAFADNTKEPLSFTCCERYAI